MSLELGEAAVDGFLFDAGGGVVPGDVHVADGVKLGGVATYCAAYADLLAGVVSRSLKPDAHKVVHESDTAAPARSGQSDVVAVGLRQAEPSDVMDALAERLAC